MFIGTSGSQFRPRYAVERKSEMLSVSNNFLDFDDNFLACSDQTV
jgi:hypothetical protein